MTPEDIIKENKPPKINTYREDTIERLTRKYTPIKSAKVRFLLEQYFPGYPYVGYFRKTINLFNKYRK